ncbi:mechanosensitive ion channel family protein [Flavobacterium sp.]|uniref:mechanosensitive ion channel family protein n=1 Tax=Flavobacterium sp. TaxID=239 RepID=UPI0035280F0B
MDNLKGSFESIWNNILENAPSIIAAALVLFIGFFIANKIKALIKKKTAQISEKVLTGGFLSQFISSTIKLISIVIALRIVGFTDLTSNLLAGAGILTFVVGFAFKDIGENFLAGIILAYKSPFRINDLIETGGITGNVVNLFLRETQLKTFDGKDVFIPNGQILKTPLYNFTIDGYLRYDFVIGLDYGTNISNAISTVLEALKDMNGVLQDTKKPNVIIDEFSASTINLRILYWVNTFEDYTVEYPTGIKTAVMKVVFDKLVAAGFSMPSDIVEIKQYNG